MVRGFASVVLAAFALDAVRAGDDDNVVTYQSAIKLQHVQSKYFLHSHQINWGSGSGQQSVTAHGGPDDQGSLWIVNEPNAGPFMEFGEPVKCGSLIRLTHMQTEKNLHTHFFSSPLSNQQEVSGFGERGRGDTSDDWEVQCKGTYWRRNEEVRFKHKDTGRLLHSHSQYRFNQGNCPNCPILGQQEVTCFGSPNAQNTWKALQGIFYHTRKEDDDPREDL